MGLSTCLSTAILAELPSCLTKIAIVSSLLSALTPPKPGIHIPIKEGGTLKLSGPVIPLLQALQQLPTQSKSHNSFHGPYHSTVTHALPASPSLL